MLSRTIYDSAIWRENPSTIKLFIYLLGSARFHREPKQFPNFKLQRGEILTSLADIADNNEWIEHGAHKKWSRAKVCRMLDSLEKGGYITRISDTYGTHIKVCNYSRYQDPSIYGSDSDETEVKRTCNGSETEVKPYKERKEGNKDKKVNKYIGVEEAYLVLPEGFRTEAVREALAKWLEHKDKEHGEYYKTTMAFAELPTSYPTPESLIKAIQWSISQKYKGIYAPPSPRQSSAVKAPAKTGLEILAEMEAREKAEADKFNLN